VKGKAGKNNLTTTATIGRLGWILNKTHQKKKLVCVRRINENKRRGEWRL